MIGNSLKRICFRSILLPNDMQALLASSMPMGLTVFEQEDRQEFVSQYERSQYVHCCNRSHFLTLEFSPSHLEDSHPDFNRNDPIASCSLKRDVCKTISKTAISKHSQQKQKDKLQFSNFELGIRAGDAMIVQFPSLLAPKIQDAESPLKVTPTLSSESSGILAGLFDTVRAQVADRKREAFRRITSDASDSRFNHADDSCSYPSGSSNTKNYTRTVGAFEDMKTATENPFKTNTFKCNPDKAFLSRSSAPSASRHSRVGSGVSGTSSSDTTRSTTSKRATELFAHYYNTKKTVKTIRNDTSATSTNVTNTNKSATDLFAQHTTNAAKMVQDNTFDRMALVREDDDGISLQDDDSFGPLPSGSPLRTSYDIEEQVSVLPNQFDSSLEPRPIGEMVQQPSCLENSIIAVIKPQKQVPV